MFSVLFLLLSLLHLTAAHFTVDYPPWRGDSFLPPASQWLRPCAGLPPTNNRTLYPLSSGPLLLTVHHPWALTYINLGYGANTTTFNISLVANFNQTGNGTFCLPRIALPQEAGVSEGAMASLQVVQIGETGSALYNCADITFSSQAQVLGGDQCVNSTGVGGVAIESVKSAAESTANTTSNTTASTGSAAASVPMGLPAMAIAFAAVGASTLIGLS